MHMTSLNKLLFQCGVGVTAFYGTSGRVMFSLRGDNTYAEYSGSAWLRSQTPDRWVDLARDFENRRRGVAAVEKLVYSSRSALKRGLDRRGININNVNVRKTEDGKFEVEVA